MIKKISLDEISSIMHAWDAIGGGLTTEDGIQAVLCEMVTILGCRDHKAWAKVFDLLGTKNPDAARMTVIRAVMKTLDSPALVRSWGLRWMKCIGFAKIHPVSLCLNAGRAPEAIRDALYSAYQKACTQAGSPTVHGYADVLPMRDGPGQILEVGPVAVENVVSAVPLVVRERIWGGTAEIGRGWCATSLAVQPMPGLEGLGEGLLVEKSVDLRLAPRVTVIGPGVKIGGRLLLHDDAPQRSRCRARGGPKKTCDANWQENLGWHAERTIFFADFRGCVHRRRRISKPDAIRFPRSCGALRWG